MSIAGIQKAVAERYSVSIRDMIGGGGEPRIKRPRQVAMYLARKYTTASLPEIATAFQKTVATVVKETRDIDAHIGIDRALEAEIEDLRRVLGLDEDASRKIVVKDAHERVGVEIVSKMDEVTINISIR